MRESSAATPTFARTFLQHVGIGVVVLAAVALVAVLVSVRTGREQALRQPVAGGEAEASRIVAPLVTQGVYDGNTKDLTALDGRVRLHKAGSAIERIKVWSEDGVIRSWRARPSEVDAGQARGSGRCRSVVSRT